MTLTIDLSPELERRLQEEASKRGIPTPEYARAVLEVHLSKAPAAGEEKSPFYATATHEEWVAAFDKWIADHAVNGPPLPPEALRREHFYGDRG
jgi:hypothetical protein